MKKNKAHQLVKTLYEELKVNFHIPNEDRDCEEERNCKDDNGGFFHELEGNYMQMNTKTETDDEILSHYMKLNDIRAKDDLLEW